MAQIIPPYEEQIFPIRDFKGLFEARVPGGPTNVTGNLKGWRARHGQLVARKGLSKFRGISAAAAAQIIGLMEYRKADGSVTVVRMLPLAVHKLNTGTNVWDDITGVALTGTSTVMPQWGNIKESLVFTNEGEDLPRKWTGAGNTVVLGGSPPFCKALSPFEGFLMLGNLSDSGTFSDLPAGPVTVRFSDDINSWAACVEDELVLDETSGEIRVLAEYDRILTALKSDSLVWVKFVGGVLRFSHDKIPFDKGILAPLSAQVTEAGIIFLATDQELYITNGQRALPLPPGVQRTLQRTLLASKARDCVGLQWKDEETYLLLYNRTGGSGLDGVLGYNYRTGEFFADELSGHVFLRALATRLSNTTANLLLASTSTLVFQLDNGQDDDGTVVTHEFHTDWTELGVVGDKYFMGAIITVRKAKDVRLKLDVARDYSSEYRFPRTFELLGGSPTDDEVQLRYRPEPFMGNKFDLRIRAFHDGSTNVAEVRAIDLSFIPLHMEVEKGVTAGAERPALRL